MQDNVKNHIDAPIRKAVAGMNLLGFKTYMSCCGFSYDNEEVPKSHLGKAYIYLDFDQVFNDERLLKLLSKICLMSGWQYKKHYNFIDFYGDTWSKDHPWSNREAVHNYEIFLLAINSLIKSIDQEKDSFIPRVTIKDGNIFYRENISCFWKYPETASWTVSASDWNTLQS